MKTIILISHATLARGMHDALKMIVGDLVNYHHVGLLENMGIEEFEKQIEILLKKEYDDLLIISDIPSGSPHIRTLLLLQKMNLQVPIISNMSLGLVINCSFLEEFSFNKIHNAIKETKVFEEVKVFEENEEL